MNNPVLLDDGSFHVFGDNYFGQLNAPEIVGNRVIYADCGEYHTCLLVDDGSIRLFGLNVDGQLDVPYLSNRKITQVSCG